MSKVSRADSSKIDSGNDQSDAAYFEYLIAASQKASAGDDGKKSDATFENKAVTSDGPDATGPNVEVSENREVKDEVKFENVDPPEDFGTSIMDRKIGEGDKTVSEKASEDFINGIKQDIKDGKLKDDSKEAKLVKLFEASAALDKGYSLYGYAEAIESSGGTYRKSDKDPTKLTGGDVKEILNEEKVSEKIAEYMQDEKISERYEKTLGDAVKKIPESERKDMSEKVKEALFKDGEPNTDFEKGIISLYESGSDADKDKAEKLTDDYFQALQQLDPDAYTDRRQVFNSLLTTHQIDKIIANPDSIPADAAKTGLADTFTLVKTGVNAALKGMKEGDKSYDLLKRLGDDISSMQKSFEGMKDEDAKKLWFAFNDAAKSGWTSTDIDKIVDGHLKGLQKDRESTAGTMKQVLHSASSSGTLGSMSGLMSLGGAVNTLVKGQGKELTSDERIALARDLVGGLSAAKDFSTFGSNLVEILGGTKETKGKGPDTGEGDGAETKKEPKIKATEWLGVWDENFPDIWGTEKPKDPLSQTISTNIADASDRLEDRPIATGLNEADSETLNNRISEDVGKAMGVGDGKSGSGGADFAKKAGQSFLRFMSGAGLDMTGGALDIVSGVRKLQKAETSLEKASAGMTLGSGVSTVGAGVANAISMFTGKGSSIASKIVAPIATKVVQGLTTVARIAGPVLGVAGAILGIAGSLIAEAVEHEKMQKLTDSQGKFFGDLADMGVAQKDWGDKLEFARYSTYMYGDRDTPDNKSIFEFQADEWKHFQETKPEKGSSLKRLAPGLHRDSDLNKRNLWEEHLSGSTTSSGVHGHERKNDNWRPWGDTDREPGKLDTTTAYYTRSVGQTYDSAFAEKHHDHIETIVESWDDWNGKDSIVSEKDLRKIVDDQGNSEDERAAAKFLLDDENFRRALDGIRERGSQDTKISSKDLNAWFKEIDSKFSV
ncbi:hypothetical protein ACRQ1B_12300 [Rhizobium panacihumi]|uniref:hypothetical protein n=1 Tax=Rhizobium panacihumi TaxID=2008450 RepID=UPI003D7B44F6